MHNKAQIVIIDDEKVIRENLSEYLTEFGFKTILAENGLEGVQKVIDKKPDLIICDIDMPGLNGYEVYGQIQQLPELSITPFIFLTAKSSANELRQGMQLGADDYITKPFKLSDILHSVNKRLEKAAKVRAITGKKLDLLAENELVGVFFYQKSGFNYMNKRLRDKLGVSLKSVSNLSMQDVLAEPENNFILEKINSCLEGVSLHIKEKLKLTKRNKSVLNATLDANHTKLAGENTIIGLIQFNGAQVPQLEVLSSALHADTSDFDTAENPGSPPELTKNLTKRENEILTLICQGLTNGEIALKLKLSNRTVENHRANILNKTNCKNTAHLVVFGIKHLSINV